MQDFEARWITNKDFCDLVPLNVFHKEMEDVTIPANDSYANKHILFRRTFTLPEFAKAVLRISADDYYKLYINGRFITQGPAPGYPFHYYYNELDVTRFLNPGTNVIAVHTYYQGLVNRVWVSADLRQGLACALYLDGRKALETDESWKCALHTGFSACGKFGYDTQFAECYDASAPECGFSEPEFDDSHWENAHLRKHADYTLFRQPTEPLDIYGVSPRKISQTPTGLWIDFGFEAVGYLTFAASGKKGDTLVLHFGEELNDDGSVRWKMRCNCDYEEKFILSGRADDVLNEYDYKAFRYAEIVLPAGVKVDTASIRFVVRHYPFTQTGQYTGKNERLRAIYKLCSDTIKYGVQECFVDCPTREKGQYLGDVTIAGLAHASLTGDPSMLRKALENYTQSTFICPGLMTVAPASLMQEIADYSLQFPFQVLWYYRFTGDKDFLRQMYPYVCGVCDFFAAYRRENGLIENVKAKWNLVDWPANLRDNYDFPLERPIGEGFHNVINAFYVAMLGKVDEIAAILGEKPTGLYESTKKAYFDAFYDPTQKLFVDSIGSHHASFHSNVIALFGGLWADDENKRAMIALIRQKRLTCAGVYMAFFALYALKECGETALMEELIADDGAWGHMLSQGATTCYEAWGKEQKWNTSLFHPWACAPVIVL